MEPNDKSKSDAEVKDLSGDYDRPVFEAVSDGCSRGYYSTPEEAKEEAEKHGNG